MTPEEAKAHQDAVVAAPPNLFVRACPGAGKTRTVVSRYLRVADEAAPQAAAVVSFTNRAADEVSQRCTMIGRPDLAQFPHYIGTFDRFIATYIVRPFGQLDGPIRIVDSWEALDVTIRGRGGKAVSLDRFTVSPDGVLRFEPRGNDPRLEGKDRLALEYKARHRRKQLRNDGHMTCEDARAYAATLLDNHPKIAVLLRERFAEIIIDEAQDCCTPELELLTHLQKAGLPVVVACDPQQAIYDWRGADPEGFAQFTSALEPIQLNGNWRSSPVICSLSATLKQGDVNDHAVGPHRHDQTPIHVIRYPRHPNVQLGVRFLKVLETVGLNATDGLILGHRPQTAAQAAGAIVKTASGNVAILAVGAARVTDTRTGPRERQREFDRLQRLMLRYVGVAPAGQSTEKAAEQAGVDLGWLRTATLHLVQSVAGLSLDTLVREWVTTARDALADIARTTNRQPIVPGRFLPARRDSASKVMSAVVGDPVAVTSVRHSTIHQAKGIESPGVLVVIPPDRAPSTRTHDLITAWEGGLNKEAKRVLYVAVTRAERLCVIAVPDRHADRVESILQRSDVPFETSSI